MFQKKKQPQQPQKQLTFPEEKSSETTSQSTPDSTPTTELQIPAPFVDAEADPQTYVDKYFSDVEYKEWFDSTKGAVVAEITPEYVPEMEIVHTCEKCGQVYEKPIHP